MSKFWHILASVGIAAIGVVVPQVSTIIASHAKVTLVLGSIWAILGNVLKSPVASQQ